MQIMINIYSQVTVKRVGRDDWSVGRILASHVDTALPIIYWKQNIRVTAIALRFLLLLRVISDPILSTREARNMKFEPENSLFYQM